MSTVAAEQALALPIAERGAALLRLPEDQWFDRKSPRISARDLADAMIGFANAEGGTIAIGLWNGKVEGIATTKTKHLVQWQQAALDFTTPAVPCKTRIVECVSNDGNPDELFVIDIETSDRVHSNKKDEVYLRVGDETRRLTFAQRQELLYDKGQSSFESTTVSDAAQPDLDRALLVSYAEAVNHPDPARLFVARGLAKPSGELTAAAVLLFATEPQRWFPEASLRILRYHGTEGGRVSTGDLVEAAGRSRPVVIRQLKALRDAGVIAWIGNSAKDPRAYWTLHGE